MSDIAKCPMCGSEPEVRRLIVCGTKVVRCVQCVTEMPPEIWKKYAAAMELAKAEVAASNAVWSVPLDRLEAALEASESMLFDAKMRVLEVFK